MSAQPQSYSIVFDAYVDFADTQVEVGYGITKNTSGSGFVHATTAALAASHSGVSHGVAITTGPVGQTFQYQNDGIVGSGFLPFVGTGAIENAVLASDGKIRRASAASGTVIGTCDLEGNVHLSPSGTVLGNLAGDVTGNPLANTVGKILNATVPALAGNGGKGLVLNALATAFTFAVLATSGYDTADHSGGGQEVLSATGSAGVFIVRNDVAQKFASSTKSSSTVGMIRAPSAADATGYSLMAIRNPSDNGDRNVVGSYVNGASGTAFRFGDAVATTEMRLYSTNVDFVSTSSVVMASLTASLLTMGPAAATGIPIAFGSAPATVGAVRLPALPRNGGAASDDYFDVFRRNGAGNGNVRVLGGYNAPGDDQVYLGDSDNTFVGLRSGTLIGFAIGSGADQAELSTSGLTLTSLAGVGTRTVTCTAAGLLVAGSAPGGSGVTWADDLSTSSDTHQYVSQITGTGNLCTVISGTSLRFTTTSCAVGLIRAANNVTILGARNAAGSGDLTVLKTTGGDAVVLGGSLVTVTPGILEVGTGVSTAGTVRLPNAGAVNFRNAAGSGNVLGLGVDNSNNVLVGDSNRSTFVYGSGVVIQGTASELGRFDTSGVLLPAATALRFGGTPATTGVLRLTNNTGMYARNAANGANVRMASIDGADNVFMGDTNTSNMYLNVKTGGVIALEINSTGYFSVTTSVMSAQSTNFALGSLGPSFNSATNTTFQANGTQATAQASGGTYVWADSGRFSFWGSNSPGSGVPVRLKFNSIRTPPALLGSYSLEVLFLDLGGVEKTGYITIDLPSGG